MITMIIITIVLTMITILVIITQKTIALRRLLADVRHKAASLTLA